MKIRIARHTSNLDSIINFYHKILGLEILASFNNHNGYDGVFLGLKNENWHLEFTVSSELPDHKPDADDLLVFYPDGMDKYEELVSSLRIANTPEISPKNPYWKENGIEFLDPDGYGVVIVKV